MIKPAHSKDQERQSRMTELYVYLGRNMVRVAILLALIAVGIIAFIIQIQGMNQRQAVREPVKPEWTGNDWQKTRYNSPQCAADPHCRLLKRIWEEGGASREAIRKNILAADKTVTFERLQEDAARYEGTPWAVEGKIIDIVGQDRRGMGDYILADIIIGGDPGKQLSVRGDFATDFSENDYVYVVGYITGTSHPRLGPGSLKYKGKVPALSARALLKPSEAREFLSVSGTN
ncbi:MAG: hypothetical protein AB1631_20220 [Acidobacteriota bacterium]